MDKVMIRPEGGSSENTTGQILHSMGWLIWIGGFLLGIYLGNKAGKGMSYFSGENEFYWNIALITWGSAFITGIVSYGFGEIICLLHLNTSLRYSIEVKLPVRIVETESGTFAEITNILVSEERTAKEAERPSVDPGVSEPFKNLETVAKVEKDPEPAYSAVEVQIKPEESVVSETRIEPQEPEASEIQTEPGVPNEPEVSEPVASAVEVPETTVEVVPESGYEPVFCSQCGTKIEESDAVFCPSCGARVIR